MQIGGSIGAAILNTVAAGGATRHLVGRTNGKSNAQAIVHGDVSALNLLAVIFFAGGVTTALSYPSAGHGSRPSSFGRNADASPI